MNKSPAPSDMPARRSPNLEPEKVLRAALGLLEEVGFKGLTLRRLAAKLDVKAAALYWHFKNKQDLIDQLAAKIILDEFAKVRPRMETDSWREILVILAYSYYDVLHRYRDGALTIASADVGRTKANDSYLFIIHRLQATGMSQTLAAVSIFAVTRYTSGCVFDEQHEPRHPEHPLGFESGLEVILDGISQRLG